MIGFQSETPSASALISAHVGRPYSWGREGCNCLALMSDFIEAHGLATPYGPWMAMTEPESWRDGLRKARSLAEGHAILLTRTGLVRHDPPWGPGDFVVVRGATHLDGHEPWDAAGGRELVLFSDDACQLWYHGTNGAQRVAAHGPVVAVWRF